MTPLPRIRQGDEVAKPAISPKAALVCLAILAAFLAAGCGDDSGTGPPATSTSEVIFTSWGDSLNADIYAFATAGQPFSDRLTDNWPLNFDPKWSPDGSKVAFVSYAFGGLSEICAIDADGTDFTRLTHDPQLEGEPTWIPTTGEVAYWRQPQPGDPTTIIEAVSLVDQSVRTILAGSHAVGPTWSADGGYLAYAGFISGYGGVIFVAAGDGSGAAMVTDTLAGSFASPAWSPDGSKIASALIPKTGPRGIFVMAADGSNLTRLTTGDLDDDPSWSPDGSRIVFSRRTGGIPQLHVMNADGSNITQITSGTEAKTDPDWSPDGQLIAYTLSVYNGVDPSPGRSVYVIETDGSNPRPLVPARAADVHPNWSLASSQLAFASNRYGDFEIFVETAGDGEEQRITNSPGEDVEPAWSRDGMSIAFTSDRNGNQEIYRTSPSGDAVVRLTDHPAKDHSPTWSPLGDIAFVSERDGNPEIYLMAADGSNLRRRTTNDAADTGPAWSPDGTRIAFASARGGNLDIYVMKADGTGLTQLTSDPAEDRDPAWSSDGQTIAFVTTREGGLTVYRMSANGSSETRFVVGEDPAWGIHAHEPPPDPGDNPVAAARP